MRSTIVLGPLNPPPPGPAWAVEKRWSRTPSLFALRDHEATIMHRDHPNSRCTDPSWRPLVAGDGERFPANTQVRNAR